MVKFVHEINIFARRGLGDATHSRDLYTGSHKKETLLRQNIAKRRVVTLNLHLNYNLT